MNPVHATHRLRYATLYSKRGSSTIEFLFCAPILLIIMYIAIDLNERIEHRVTSVIALNNVAWTNTSIADRFDEARRSTLESLSMADILGTKSPSGDGLPSTTVGSDVNSPDINNNAILTFNSDRRRQDAYLAKLDYNLGDAARDAAARRYQTQVGDTDAAVMPVLTSLANAVSFIERPAFVQYIFPGRNSFENYQLSWMLRPEATQGAGTLQIARLTSMVDRTAAGSLNFMQSPSYRLLANHSLFIRRDAQYHTEEYRYQIAMGWVLGLSSNSMSRFTDECAFNLKDRREYCTKTRQNGYREFLKNKYETFKLARAGIDLVISTYMGTGIGAPLGIAMEATKRIAIAKIKSEIEDVVIGQGMDEIRKNIKPYFEGMLKDSINIGDFSNWINIEPPVISLPPAAATGT